MKSVMFVMCGLLAAVMVAGCEKEQAKAPTAAAATSASAAESLPRNLIATTQPAGAIDVVTAKKSVKDGDRVVIKGRVGGQKEPMAANRAILTIADLGLRTCDKSPMKTCETPWDSCCEAKDEIVAKTASVQVVGADGRPIKAGLANVTGLAPMKQIVVAGIAKKLAGSDALVIEAKEIYLAP